MRVLPKSLPSLVLSVFLWQSALAESPKDSIPAKRRNLSILPVPAFGYEPETKAYIGAVCLFNWRFRNDTVARPSNAKVEVN
jgi:hypothetical protein